MLMGALGSGKTTLCRRINNSDLEVVKTQSIYASGIVIDTPGEYTESRTYMNALIVTSFDADNVLFVADPTQETFCFSPGQAAAFPCPVIGVVSKTDIAARASILKAKEILIYAGATKIFFVSGITGEGMDGLLEYINEEEDKRFFLAS
jgi:ethanolamine utilization protein EutP